MSRRGNYGRLTALALDPIEKKPLARFYPGRQILSVGTYGCNLRCPWCQNQSISMPGLERRDDGVFDLRGLRLVSVTPRELAAQALAIEGNLGVAYTYNEPLTAFDFVRDTARLVRDNGQKNVLVTNGCFGDRILDEVLPWIDAMNIDLKSFRPEGYRQIGGRLDVVQHFIERAAAACHVELTTLVVPGFSDGIEDMKREAAWIAAIDENIPLHISRFFPAFRMRDAAPTDPGLVRRLAETARESLKYVYLGNM
ncbi:MAG: radical SAM protein [Anaerovoracaceae bacterium]|jgi:pyruvate formate lyase activating enzyme